MKQQIFEARRTDLWRRFETQLEALREARTPEAFDAEDFARSYQSLARDLSAARSRGYSSRLVRYLNDLVVAGHTFVYARRSGYAQAVRDFVTWGFPLELRRASPYVLVSLALFAGSLLAMLLTVVLAPEWVYTVMSANQTAQLEGMYDPQASVYGRERPSDSDFAMFGYYIMNNVGISFQLFASGLLLGLGSVGYLLFNGIYIGAAAGHMVNAGFAETFFAFVAGHGPFELTAIVIAGAAGLMLGHGLLSPGESSRLVALRRQARRAVRLVLGAALMLLVAAFVEAFWSSTSAVPPVIKHVVGGLGWLAVLAYLLLAGRRRDVDAPA